MTDESKYTPTPEEEVANGELSELFSIVQIVLQDGALWDHTDEVPEIGARVANTFKLVPSERSYFVDFFQMSLKEIGLQRSINRVVVAKNAELYKEELDAIKDEYEELKRDRNGAIRAEAYILATQHNADPEIYFDWFNQINELSEHAGKLFYNGEVAPTLNNFSVQLGLVQEARTKISPFALSVMNLQAEEGNL